MGMAPLITLLLDGITGGMVSLVFRISFCARSTPPMVPPDAQTWTPEKATKRPRKSHASDNTESVPLSWGCKRWLQTKPCVVSFPCMAARCRGLPLVSLPALSLSLIGCEKKSEDVGGRGRDSPRPRPTRTPSAHTHTHVPWLTQMQQLQQDVLTAEHRVEQLQGEVLEKKRFSEELVAQLESLRGGLSETGPSSRLQGQALQAMTQEQEATLHRNEALVATLEAKVAQAATEAGQATGLVQILQKDNAALQQELHALREPKTSRGVGAEGELQAAQEALVDRDKELEVLRAKVSYCWPGLHRGAGSRTRVI